MIFQYDLVDVDESDRKGKKHPNARAATIIQHAYPHRDKKFRNQQTIDRKQFIEGYIQFDYVFIISFVFFFRCKNDPVIRKLLDCNFRYT
jgi:hypothetical protein